MLFSGSPGHRRGRAAPHTPAATAALLPQFDLVGWLLGGSTSVWSRIVFALVGLAALGCIPELFSEEPEEE